MREKSEGHWKCIGLKFGTIWIKILDIREYLMDNMYFFYFKDRNIPLEGASIKHCNVII